MNIPVSVPRSVMLLALLTASPLSWGGNMVFQFVNPNFGGNPNNGSFLLNEAQAQNSYKDPDSYDFGSSGTSALDNFTSSIQSQLLGSLMGNINQGKRAAGDECHRPPDRQGIHHSGSGFVFYDELIPKNKIPKIIRYEIEIRREKWESDHAQLLITHRSFCVERVPCSST